MKVLEREPESLEATRVRRDAKHPIHDLLARRWSPRAFSSRLLEPEALRSLFEAARWAPSSYNEQPWSFIVATRDNTAQFETMLSVLVEGNRRWAKDAPVLMLAVAQLNGERTGKPNRHALYDVGQAVAHLTVQATALNLYVHQMAGFDADKARRLFNIPPGYEPVTALALGYLADSAYLPEERREGVTKLSGRKPLENFVFGSQWGQPSSLLAETIKGRKPCSKSSSPTSDTTPTRGGWTPAGTSPSTTTTTRAI